MSASSFGPVGRKSVVVCSYCLFNTYSCKFVFYTLSKGKMKDLLAPLVARRNSDSRYQIPHPRKSGVTFLLQFAHQSLTDTGGLLHTVDS